MFKHIYIFLIYFRRENYKMRIKAPRDSLVVTESISSTIYLYVHKFAEYRYSDNDSIVSVFIAQPRLLHIPLKEPIGDGTLIESKG